MALELGFGATLPDTVKLEDLEAVWGGRAIWQGYKDWFDIPFDRQQCSGEDKPRKALATWTNKQGLKQVRKWAAKVGADSSDVFLSEDGIFGIRATPNSSYGYMYIRTWMKKEVPNGKTDPA